MPDLVNDPELLEVFVPDTPTEPDIDAELLNDVADIDSNIDPDIDAEMLKVLGDLETDDVEWGEDVQSDIAKRVQFIVTNGLKKDLKEELSKKYLFPKNIPLLKAPALNPEIRTMLNESSRNRDKRLSSKQEQHGRTLTALTRAMSLLLKKQPDISEVLRVLNDALKMLSDSHFLETDTRKSLILGLIEKSLVDSFKDRRRDEFLFGDKLGDLVKSSRGIKKTGQLIQAPSTSALNWKGPPARPRLQRNNQQPAGRASGYQAQYASRRRVVQPPAPPPARRPPPQAAPRRQPAAYAPQYAARRPPPPPPPRAT